MHDQVTSSALEPMIHLREISKSFPLRRHGDHTVLARLVRSIGCRALPVGIAEVHALRNVSLKVAPGEILGIVGRNAGGKTTLLRIIAGILEPDTGSVSVSGKVVPLLSLGVGLQEQLGMEENIRLLCLLFGMSKTEAESSITDIIAFADLNSARSLRPSQLSQGQKQRLVFAVAVHTAPEILLLDEVFSTGDIVFREKGMERMQSLIKGGATVIMVSHDLKRIEHVCDRVVWIERGVIRMDGESKEVLNAYREAFTKSHATV